VNPFSGGVAVITGAGAGIGAGLASHAATLGMTVVLADIDGDAIAALRDGLPGAVAVVCDVRDPAAVQELADRTYRDVGPVRLLVNNAGVEQFGYLWDTPVANWQRVVDINVSGVFHGVRAFLPKMMGIDEQAWVWNLSSVGGVLAIPLQAPYIMSKHAVLALTECLYLMSSPPDTATTFMYKPCCRPRWYPTSLSRRAEWTPMPPTPPSPSPSPNSSAARCLTSRPRRWLRAQPPQRSSSTPPRAGSICLPSRPSARPWRSARMSLQRSAPQAESHQSHPSPGGE